MQNLEEKIRCIKGLHEVQGRNGTWNYDPYMHGMFNALELVVSLFEDRSPEFRNAPESWITDKPIADDVERSVSNDNN